MRRGRARGLKIAATGAPSKGQSNIKRRARVEAASTHAHRIQRKFILNQTRRITNTNGTSNELIMTDDCRRTDCFEEIMEYRHKQVKEDQMKPVDLREFKEKWKN